LPGAGYAALHPELKDIDPEDYPDIHKMAILADVAPYSREYTRSFRPDGHQKPRAHATGRSLIHCFGLRPFPALSLCPGRASSKLFSPPAGHTSPMPDARRCFHLCHSAR
jgi:hypothetical protein